MPKPLNDLERRVLDYIVEYLRTNTYQPSIREIGREFAIKSTKTVSELLHSLAVKGWIERDPSRSRGVRLIGMEMRADTVSVPVFDAPQSPVPVSHYELDRKIVAASGCYLLPMKGDHLLEDGLRQGDLLLIEPVAAGNGVPGGAESGDILVITVGGANEVRRCARSGESLVVEPVRTGESPTALATLSAAGAIQGRVSGVIRRLRAAAVLTPSLAAATVPA